MASDDTNNSISGNQADGNAPILPNGQRPGVGSDISRPPRSYGNPSPLETEDVEDFIDDDSDDLDSGEAYEPQFGQEVDEERLAQNFQSRGEQEARALEDQALRGNEKISADQNQGQTQAANLEKPENLTPRDAANQRPEPSNLPQQSEPRGQDKDKVADIAKDQAKDAAKKVATDKAKQMAVKKAASSAARKEAMAAMTARVVAFFSTPTGWVVLGIIAAIILLFIGLALFSYFFKGAESGRNGKTPPQATEVVKQEDWLTKLLLLSKDSKTTTEISTETIAKVKGQINGMIVNTQIDQSTRDKSKEVLDAITAYESAADKQKAADQIVAKATELRDLIAPCAKIVTTYSEKFVISKQEDKGFLLSGSAINTAGGANQKISSSKSLCAFLTTLAADKESGISRINIAGIYFGYEKNGKDDRHFFGKAISLGEKNDFSSLVPALGKWIKDKSGDLKSKNALPYQFWGPESLGDQDFYITNGEFNKTSHNLDHIYLGFKD